MTSRSISEGRGDKAALVALGRDSSLTEPAGGTIIALVYIFPYLPLCSTYLKLVFEHSAEIEKRVNKMAGRRMFN
jgi:hypothetical protein